MNDSTLRAVAGEEWERREQAEKLYGRMSAAWMTANRALIAKLVAAVEERDRMLAQAHEAFKPDIPLASFLRDLDYLASLPDGKVYDPTAKESDA